MFIVATCRYTVIVDFDIVVYCTCGYVVVTLNFFLV